MMMMVMLLMRSQQAGVKYLAVGGLLNPAQQVGKVLEISISSDWVCLPGFREMYTDHYSPVMNILVVGYVRQTIIVPDIQCNPFCLNGNSTPPPT